jgi:hypothetical protein
LNILYGIGVLVLMFVPGTFAFAIVAYPFLPKRAKRAIVKKLRRLIAEARAQQGKHVQTGRLRFKKIFGKMEEPRKSEPEQEDASQAITVEMPIQVLFRKCTLRYRVSSPRRRRIPVKPTTVMVRA